MPIKLKLVVLKDFENKIKWEKVNNKVVWYINKYKKGDFLTVSPLKLNGLKEYIDKGFLRVISE
ncbi:hypothetical protein AB0Y20_01225 [Heyndrickxia oleronia]|uniref:hypothetical protein n=1 Tax=Heyndrickxia oleronia TaxID=38875 RepID=UPI003F23A123